MRTPGYSTRSVRGLGLLTLFLLGLTDTSCAGMVVGTLRGQVVDAQTGTPIQGAIVLGVWTTKEGPIGLASTKLVAVKEVETDAEGRFELERPWGAHGGDHESVTVYKFGYIAWNNLYIYPVSENRKDTRVPAEIRLEAFPPGGDHQKHMDFISDATWSTISHQGRKPKFDEALERERRMR